MFQAKKAAVVILCVGVGVVATLVTQNEPARASDVEQKSDLRTLSPGQRRATPMGDFEMEISVPEGEGATGGTFRVQISPVGFDSGAIKRHGSLEAAWITDVNEDTIPDAVIVVRGGGSGSYASIVVVESSGGSFVATHLPSTSPTPGYMGHDSVSVKDGTILRSFPTDKNLSELPSNREPGIEPGMNGESSISQKPDQNANTSGMTKEERFDRASGSWRNDS